MLAPTLFVAGLALGGTPAATVTDAPSAGCRPDIPCAQAAERRNNWADLRPRRPRPPATSAAAPATAEG